ncbi:hypothetical protein WG908_10850 [Sphingobium sp. AN641]|uniref:hypothetical protein n=1 Tax=Sphingobium sp. AN641 TaxID=3133443 RepID=UPI0030C041AB
MPYLLEDLFGLLMATWLAPLLFILPGFGLARLAGGVGLDCDDGWRRAGWAMLLAFALFPILDSLLIRWIGIGAAVALHIGLLIYGAPLLRRLDWRRTGVFVSLAAVWWLICAWAFVDIDWDGGLHQSLVVYDLVKHAAVTEQIARIGLPLRDPFFAREGVAGYYHYFYEWPAMVRWTSGFAISARMAFAACAFWTGMAVPALLWRLAADARLIGVGRERGALLMAALLCFVTGLDILPVALRWNVTGWADPHIDMWNSEVAWMLRSSLWVPHHLAAVIAGWTGILIASRAPASPVGWSVAGMAGVAFASMFGLSAWVALTFAPLLVVWGGIRLTKRDGRLLAAGTLAAILSIPQFLDLAHGRSGEFPIGFAVRSFMWLLPEATMLSQVGNLLLLPVNYALEFGLFALGGAIALSFALRRPDRVNDVAALLLASAITSLVIASFMQSVLINNDLGWRSTLLAQVAALVATVHVAQYRGVKRHYRQAAILLGALGMAGTLYDVIGLRLIRQPYMPARTVPQNRAPDIDLALRRAYGWADVHLPEGAVLQHAVGMDRRAFDFGLYGHRWPAVADQEASLFGAGQYAVLSRIALLKPIFTQRLAPDQLAARARAARVNYLLFTRNDPVWASLTLPCLYRSRLICITRVEEG